MMNPPCCYKPPTLIPKQDAWSGSWGLQDPQNSKVCQPMEGLAHLPTPGGGPHQHPETKLASPHRDPQPSYPHTKMPIPEKNAHTKCNLHLQTTTCIFTKIHAQHTQYMALSFESQIPTLESGQSTTKNLLRPETLSLFLFLQLFFPRREKTMIQGT